jgi:hypothetical protein
MLKQSAIFSTTLFLFAFQLECIAQSVLPAPTPEDFEAQPEIAIEQELPEPMEPAAVRAQPPADFEPYLGVTLDPQLRNVAVAQVVAPGSPAEQAGLQPGDTIEAINGRPVVSYQDVLDSVDAMQPGDRLDIDYSRRIRVRTQAVLDGRPIEARQSARYAPTLEAPANRYPQAVRQAPEQLPPPASYVDRGRRDYRPYNSPPSRQLYNTNQNARRNEDDRERRPNDRPRGLLQRSERNRPLLPWRRN